MWQRVEAVLLPLEHHQECQAHRVYPHMKAEEQWLGSQSQHHLCQLRTLCPPSQHWKVYQRQGKEATAPTHCMPCHSLGGTSTQPNRVHEWPTISQSYELWGGISVSTGTIAGVKFAVRIQTNQPKCDGGVPILCTHACPPPPSELPGQSLVCLEPGGPWWICVEFHKGLWIVQGSPSHPSGQLGPSWSLTEIQKSSGL